MSATFTWARNFGFDSSLKPRMVDHSLQLRLSQKLALAPQLQQAIKLLQLTRIELREYLQQTVEANPLLEHIEPGMDNRRSGHDEDWEPAEAEQARARNATRRTLSVMRMTGPRKRACPNNGAMTAVSAPTSKAQIVDQSTGFAARTPFVPDQAWPSSVPTDAAIATAIVFALDDEGYLVDSLGEIRASLAPETLVEDAEVLAVLHRIQRMEPVGVATRDPAECIRVQLSVLPGGTRGHGTGQAYRPRLPGSVAEHDVAAAGAGNRRQ